MKCSCPKCSLSITIDESSIPEHGDFTHCPECNSRFWTHKEAFMLRAYKKEGAVFCYSCGDEIGSANFCGSCYTPFPDYWVVQLTKPARRKSHNPTFSLSLPSFSNRQDKKYSHVSAGRSADVSATVFETFKSQKLIILAVACLILLVGLGTAGANYYKNYKIERQFIETYVKALYGIKSGTEVSLKKLETMSASGLPLKEAEIEKLDKIKIKIAKIKESLGTPPEQFLQTTKDLAGLYQVYTELHLQAVAPAGLKVDSADELKQINNKLTVAEQTLKKNIHEDIYQEIDAVVAKYRNLKFIVE